jgi:hypothetical protein
MSPNNKRKKHINTLASNKRAFSKPAHTDIVELDEEYVEESMLEAEGTILYPVDENEKEWKDVMAESESEEEWDEDIEENVWKELLTKMQSNASENKPHLRAPYTGTSERTTFRQKARTKALKAAAAGSQSIMSYFIQGPVPEVKAEVEWEASATDEEPSDDDLEEDDKEDELILEGKMIMEINEYLTDKKNQKTIGTEEKAKLQAVLQYLRLRQTGMDQTHARIQVATANGKTPYWGRCLVRWAKEWSVNKKIVLSRRGKHPKTKNLLTDSDVYLRISSWLREHHKFDVTPRMLQKYVSESVLPNIGVSNENKGISEKTATRWLRALGWIRSEAKKGVSVDGHERPDVVTYREDFLQKMKEYERRMIRAKDGEPDTLEMPTELSNEERPLVFYTHDESIFYSNDGQRVIWHPKGEMPLRKKGRGRSIMVSEFISEVDGPLRHTRADGSRLEAREIIQPGKQYDGYWTGKGVAEQFKKAIAIHKEKFSDYDALWAFDNSSNHNCFADNALLVSRMNLGPGGQQALLRDTIFNGQKQTMVFPDNHPDMALRGKAKGMRLVLKERGLWRNRLLKTCEACRLKTEGTPTRLTCCAQRILELQPDFQAQKSLLEEIAEAEGQKVIFYPKFHCEFNYIEMYWGASKRYTRDNCDYSFNGLKSTVPAALESVGIGLIRRFANKAFRYMDAYRLGLTGADAEKQVKKYRSHRRIPANWATDL